MSEKVSARQKLSRRERFDLDIEIGFLEGLVRRDPGYVEALELLGDDYIRRGNIVEGIRIDQRLARLHPEDPRVFYNLACGHALLRQLNRAVVALCQAIDAGYRDFEWMAQDPDLDNLRRNPLYRKVLVKIRSLRTKVC